MHLGAASARPWEGRARHPSAGWCWWYSGGIIVEGPICFGKSGRSMMAVPSGDEDGMRLARAGSVTLLSARLVWM
jgi:hypothetical protein